VPLHSRIINTGTLSEPKGAPDPHFALPSTINWMRALAVLVKDLDVGFSGCTTGYSHVLCRKATQHEENTILEQLLFALHQCSAVHALRAVPCKADVSRVGIVAWYYGVYAAASAMVTAQDGSFQDDHSGTAKVWDQQIAARNLVVAPFDLRLTSLVKKTADQELKLLLSCSKFNLSGTPPTNADEARGAIVAYLSGNANYWRWRAEEDVRGSKEFKGGGFADFRSNAAKALRDARLSSRAIGFLHQAIRYRGKANYREALFLGYGATIETQLTTYIDDLATVLDAFVAMAGAFCARRLGPAVWNEFYKDIEQHRSFTVGPSAVWAAHGGAV
jgi:hypothetical protein